MPKSKRVRAGSCICFYVWFCIVDPCPSKQALHACIFTVNLSAKVTANPRARKEKLVDDIQNAVDEYERAFVFEFDNMRSNYFKQLRVEWGKSR